MARSPSPSPSCIRHKRPDSGESSLRLRLAPPRRARQNAKTFEFHSNLERALKVYQIILLLWVVVFAFWLVKQFADHNKRSGR
jgi:hypothetical protein